MLNWLAENLGTILVCAVLAAAVTAAALGMIRAKKKGASSCGCGCADCPMHGACHEKK